MIKPTRVEFSVDGLTLRGKFYGPMGPAKDIAVLFIHGWTGMPNELAAAFLAEHGFYAMTFSLSGHNDSDGTLQAQTRRKSLKEALAAYDFFKNKIPERKAICVAGNSYGGYLAPLLSAERSVASIQMRVPANYPDAHFSKPQLGQGGEDPEVMEWRHKPLANGATKSLRALRGFRGPVQIIEAELDDRVPSQTVQNYVQTVSDRATLDYHFMKGWPHSLELDKGRNAAYQQMLLEWLNAQA